MKRLGSAIFLSVVMFSLQGQELPDGWVLFSDVKFESKYSEEGEGYFLYPKFGEDLRAYEGKEVELQGYFIPIDTGDDMLIISRYSYASCFFCGGAGPESVAAVLPREKLPRFYMDQVITVRGKLELNSSNINQLNFIIREATVSTDD